MHILVIGSDRNVFNVESASAMRQKAYGAHFDAFDIIVFSRRSQKYAPTMLSPGIHAYPTSSRSRLFYGFDALVQAFRLPKPDVISVQDPFEAGLIGLVIARLRGVPLHVQVHTDLYNPEFVQHSFSNRIRLLFARIVLSRASRIRVVSNRIKRSLQTTNYKLQTVPTVLPIFVDINRFRNAEAGNLTHRFRHFRRKLLVVARLEKEKNVTLAIGSFAKAAPEDACLIILGEGSERASLEALVHKLGIESRVFFEDSQDPAPYYALADLVLMTSEYEGYGLVIIEALAAGKPVLATNVGIAREAGAIITTSEKFSDTLSWWFQDGSREGRLLNYPYSDFDGFVRAYVADLVSCTKA
ncbi:MAG: glycosyltransferase [Minisyncoccia bacterium]